MIGGWMPVDMSERIFTHGQHSQGDRHVYASRTHFIPEKLLGLFERTNAPAASPGAAVRGPSKGPRFDIGARARDVELDMVSGQAAAG
jgi:DNA helicase-2/ATP-dependent DNA helicase PcrA